MDCGSYVIESDVAAVGVIRGVWVMMGYVVDVSWVLTTGVGCVRRRHVVGVENEGGG